MLVRLVQVFGYIGGDVESCSGGMLLFCSFGTLVLCRNIMDLRGPSKTISQFLLG